MSTSWFATRAAADVGLPLIAVFLPPLWLALVPVVLVEAALAARPLHLPFRRSLVALGAANVVSTLIGIPVLWLFLPVIELLFFGTAHGLDSLSAKLYAVTAQAPWLIPYEENSYWIIPAALETIAVPCLAPSVVIEAPIV